MTARKNGSTFTARPFTASALTAELYRHAQMTGAGSPTFEKSKLLATLAGRVIGFHRTQIEYAKARKEKPEIPFLK